MSKRDLEAIDDYVTGGLAAEDELAFEAELFDAAASADAKDLAFFSTFYWRALELVERGTFSPLVTQADVEALDREKLRVGYHQLAPGEQEQRLSRDLDVAVAFFPIPLDGVERLDAEFGSGKMSKTLPDVRFDPADGGVFACCDIELAAMSDQLTTFQRFYSVEPSGDRKLLAEFIIHTSVVD
jgi:hypothetical protein